MTLAYKKCYIFHDLRAFNPQDILAASKPVYEQYIKIFAVMLLRTDIFKKSSTFKRFSHAKCVVEVMFQKLNRSCVSIH